MKHDMSSFGRDLTAFVGELSLSGSVLALGGAVAPGIDGLDDGIPSWKKFRTWMATHMTYGGAGITTNRINGMGTAPVNGGWGLNTGGLTCAVTDTALYVPSGEARVAGAYSQQTTAADVPNDTSQVIVTIQASATRAITEFGLFDVLTAAPQTTATATVTAGAGTISVASTAGFAAGYAQIDAEVVQISSATAGVLTVTRGKRGSTSAAHASGVTIVGGEGLAGGNMFMKGDFSVINLNNGDSIQFTARVQLLPQ